MDPELEIGEVGACLDSSAARHKLSVRPRRKHGDPRARITRSSSDSNLQRYVNEFKKKKKKSLVSINFNCSICN